MARSAALALTPDILELPGRRLGGLTTRSAALALIPGVLGLPGCRLAVSRPDPRCPPAATRSAPAHCPPTPTAPTNHTSPPPPSSGCDKAQKARKVTQVKLWAAREHHCGALVVLRAAACDIPRAGLNPTARVVGSGGLEYLHPGLKHGRMSPHEERLILELHARW
ncbi:hypothetical protein ABZP36_002284 [Zizania latifolia]